MTPEELDRALAKANKDASDKRSADAMKGLALIIGIPLALVLLFALFGD